MFVPKSDLIRLLNAFGTISDLPIELVLSLHYSLLIPLKFFLYDGSRIWITPYSTLKSRHFALFQMLVDIFVKFTNVLAFFSDIIDETAAALIFTRNETIFFAYISYKD